MKPHYPAPYIIPLPRIYDPRGSLTFAEGCNQIPFRVSRVYWIYDVPAGEERGSHAHREMESVIVAVSGSFDVCLSDGVNETVFRLNKPYEGLYVPPMVWRTLRDFSSGSVCLSVVSVPYDEDEYIRDYDEFVNMAGI